MTITASPLEHAWRLNHESPERFALTGNDANTVGGFATLSGYLLCHPLLTPNDKLILQYLIYRAESYQELAACRTVASRASRDDVARDLNLGLSTVKRVLPRLEAFGLIERDRTSRTHAFLLLPGPWPRLGDRPERGMRWREFYLMGGLQRTMQAFLHSERGLGMSEFLGKRRKAKRTSEDPDMGQNEPYDENNGGSHHGSDWTISQCNMVQNEPPKSSMHRGMEETHTASSTQENDASLARARGLSIYKGSVSEIQRTSSEAVEPAGSTRETFGTPPAGPPGEEPGDGQGQDQGQNQGHNPGPSVGVTVVSHRNPELEKVEKEVKSRTPRKASLPVSRFCTVYRRRADEEYDWIIGPFDPKQRAQVTQAMKRYGGDRIMALLEWGFDHWEEIKRGNDLFRKYDQPPLALFTSYALIDTYLPYAQGRPFTTTAASWDEIAQPEVEQEFLDVLKDVEF